VQPNDDVPRTLEVCLRSSVTGVIEARQSAVLDRAEQLKRAGVVDSVAINYWGSRVTMPDDDARNDSGCPTVVAELYDRAEVAAWSLAPAFHRKAGDEDGRTTLFLPVVCLVVREAGEVVDAYPTTVDGDHRSVEDGLDALTGQAMADARPAPVDSAPSG
jgi:hypothetical protein